MRPIKLAYAPTRRSIFSAPDAVKYRNLTAQRLRELGVDFVDIDDINEGGLLYSEEDRLKMLAKFRAAGVDGLLLAHCNFGTEYLCARLADAAPMVRQKTGLPLSPYFSAPKLAWMLEHIPAVRQAADAGTLCCGTVDSWLLWNLTRERVHRTDYSNASRTGLFNIHTLHWDEEH